MIRRMFLYFLVLASVFLIPVQVLSPFSNQLIPDSRITGRENCRLFGMVKDWHSRPEGLEEMLTRFSSPSRPQENGWSLAMYSDYYHQGTISTPGLPLILRSELNVEYDQPVFSSMVRLFVRLNPHLMLGHLRNASSGCLDVIDPHPFHRCVNDTHYLFIHNGGVWDEDLHRLTDHLLNGEAEPQSCPDYPIDSEYLFLYFLNILENVESKPFEACKVWLTNLLGSFGEDWNALNVIITDGTTIWTIRSTRTGSGFHLHYKELNDELGYIIATEALDSDFELMSNFTIGEFQPGSPPRIIQIRTPDVIISPNDFNLLR
jgi:predicted glutamine amidotransferase